MNIKRREERKVNVKEKTIFFISFLSNILKFLKKKF